MNDVLVAKEQVRYEQKALLAQSRWPPSSPSCSPWSSWWWWAHRPGRSAVPGTTLRYDQYVVVAMLAFGLMGACYTNLAMTICLRRDNGMLKRMRGHSSRSAPIWAASSAA